MAEVKCAKCGQGIYYNPADEGKEVACVKCGAPVVISLAPDVAAEYERQVQMHRHRMETRRARQMMLLNTAKRIAKYLKPLAVVAFGVARACGTVKSPVTGPGMGSEETSHSPIAASRPRTGHQTFVMCPHCRATALMNSQSVGKKQNCWNCSKAITIEDADKVRKTLSKLTPSEFDKKQRKRPTPMLAFARWYRDEVLSLSKAHAMVQSLRKRNAEDWSVQCYNCEKSFQARTAFIYGDPRERFQQLGRYHYAAREVYIQCPACSSEATVGDEILTEVIPGKQTLIYNGEVVPPLHG